MIIHKPLNEIFSTYSNIAVIRELRYTRNGFTGREIAKRAGLSAPATLSALTHLAALKVVKRQIGGRDHLFTLNFNNYFVKKVLLPILEQESQFFTLIKTRLKKHLSTKAISVIIFGSVARQKEDIESDLDICIVFSSSENKKLLENEINILRDELSTDCGVTLAPYYISVKEFKQRAKMKKSPVNDIVKEGIVISGKSINWLLNE